MSAKSNVAPELVILLRRTRDGSASLTCTRRDGSTTWHRQAGSLGLVFPAHDLTHYAVETALGYRQGFYGLLADGWDISDFARPWPRGPIPAEAREVELIVGVFDMERRMGGWTAAEFQEQGSVYAASGRGGRNEMRLPPLTDAVLARVKALRDDLVTRWALTKPGETLQLEFTRA